MPLPLVPQHTRNPSNPPCAEVGPDVSGWMVFDGHLVKLRKEPDPSRSRMKITLEALGPYVFQNIASNFDGPRYRAMASVSWQMRRMVLPMIEWCMTATTLAKTPMGDQLSPPFGIQLFRFAISSSEDKTRWRNAFRAKLIIDVLNRMTASYPNAPSFLFYELERLQYKLPETIQRDIFSRTFPAALERSPSCAFNLATYFVTRVAGSSSGIYDALLEALIPLWDDARYRSTIADLFGFYAFHSWYPEDYAKSVKGWNQLYPLLPAKSTVETEQFFFGMWLAATELDIGKPKGCASYCDMIAPRMETIPPYEVAFDRVSTVGWITRNETKMELERIEMHRRRMQRVLDEHAEFVRRVGVPSNYTC